VPEDYFLGDKALYLAAVRANKPVYSRTGVIPAAGMKSAAEMLLAFDDELKGANVDLAKTFDGRFVEKAAAQPQGRSSNRAPRLLVHVTVGLIQHSAPTCVIRGLDHASRVHPTCALKAPEIGFPRFRVVHHSSQGFFAKRMDCRGISAFTRVFDALCPAMTKWV